MKKIFALFLLWIVCQSSVMAQSCYSSSISSPVPFMGTGQETVTLADSTKWKITDYTYLYLYSYYPSVTICPSTGKLTVGTNTFNVTSLSTVVVPTTYTFRVCNQSSVGAVVAFARNDLATTNFISHGWYSVGAGSCNTVSSSTTGYRYFYVYAEGSGGEIWQDPAGANKFCVDTTHAFDIPYGSCAPAFVEKNFIQVDTGPTSTSYVYYLPAIAPATPTISAQFTASPKSGNSPLIVNFYGTGGSTATTDQLSYLWTFGDGATSNQQNPVHTYAAAGTYIATLKVSNAPGQSAMSSAQTVTVNSITGAPVTDVAAQKLAVGYSTTCAVLGDGAVQCWGANEYGQLGNGTNTESTTPTTVSGIRNATAVSAGDAHTCSVLIDGTVQCWGANSSGQLGNGATTNSTTPVTVIGINNATSVTARYFGDACAVLNNGTVKCWGANEYGQLGNGTYNRSLTPVAVAGIGSATSISTGYSSHTCVNLANGSIQCWGANDQGQLGNGTTTRSNVPVGVIGVSNAIAVSGGNEYTCALQGTGTIQCWGFNGHGQLGNGTTTKSLAPVTVTGINTAKSIATGGYHTCAVLTNGTVQCWGANGSGELGNGSKVNSSTPVTVPGVSNATSVAAGLFHTCALLSSGNVQCWGANFHGNLGSGDLLSYSSKVTVLGENAQGLLNLRSSTPLATTNADKVFLWAEQTFPQFFSGGQTSTSKGGYRTRFYATTASTLLVNEAGTPSLFYTGPITNNQMFDLGPLSGWLAQAVP